MQETLNQVFMTGLLVKKDLQEVEATIENEQKQTIPTTAIRGSVVIRTNDGSENEVKYYAKKLTKKGTENGLYKGLKTVMEEYKPLEDFPNEADVIKIGSGKFGINDYKNKELEIKSFNEVKANFLNRIEAKDLEKTPQESKFEIEGVVEELIDEIIKDEPTGNLLIKFVMIGYENTLIPIKLTVPQPLVDPFKSAGFYAGGYAKFVGKIVNTEEHTQIVEKMGFGQDNIKDVTRTVRRYEVVAGNPMGTPIEKGITEEEWAQAKAKRKIHLDSLQAPQERTASTSGSSNPFGGATPSSNPFAGSNPFAK